MALRTLRLPPWLPWGLLALGAAATILAYPGMPETWAVHYNAWGEEDGWVAKSWAAALGPFALGVLVAAVLEVVGRLVPASPPFPLAEEWRVLLQEWQLQALRAISSGTAVLVGSLALTLPRVHSPHLPLLLVAPLLALAVLWPAWTLGRLVLAMREAGALPRGYQGMIYRDPEDPRLLVPRLTGGGSTLNLAHPRAWFLLVFLVLLPLAVLAWVAMTRLGP